MRLFMANVYIIVVFGRQRQEELEFKVNLSYVASLRTARVISQKQLCMYVPVFGKQLGWNFSLKSCPKQYEHCTLSLA